MKIIISGKNIDLTEGIKSYVNEKLEKLSKFFTDDTTATVKVKVEKNAQIVEINIPVKGNLIRVSESNKDLYAAIDFATDKIERQIRKYRTKIRDKKLHTIMKNVNEGSFINESIDDINDVDETNINIVKKKQLLLKPMSDDEACMQLDMIGHEFFIFENNDGKISVAYRRADGDFGIIETDKE